MTCWTVLPTHISTVKLIGCLQLRAKKQYVITSNKTTLFHVSTLVFCSVHYFPFVIPAHATSTTIALGSRLVRYLPVFR